MTRKEEINKIYYKILMRGSACLPAAGGKGKGKGGSKRGLGLVGNDK